MAYITSIKILLPLTMVLGVLLVYNSLSAQWAGPGATPPEQNSPAPINIGRMYQPKFGDLGAVRMRAGEYCDAAGLNCYTIAELAASGGAGITLLRGGLGIIMDPTTITSTGTINVDTTYIQRKIISNCPVGQSIRQINADGSVVCQDVNPTCQLKGISFTAGSTCRSGQGSCGLATRYNSLACQSDGSWTTQSFCTSLSQPFMASCP